MVRLKNIQFHDSLAEADYYPEEGLVKGHVVVDLESKEICSFEIFPIALSYKRS